MLQSSKVDVAVPFCTILYEVSYFASQIHCQIYNNFALSGCLMQAKAKCKCLIIKAGFF